MMFERVLAIGAHPDDVEFGAGGVISRFIEEKKEVYYIAFSDCRKSVPKGFPEDILRYEIVDAAKALGIKEKNVSLFDYEVRIFPQLRQQILEHLVKINRELSPDLVLTHCPDDNHQDHQTISMESFRAFKETSSIWGYEIPWNAIKMVRTMFVQLQAGHLKKKIEALTKYKSQMERLRLSGLSIKETIRTTAQNAGFQVRFKYAEAFDVIRTIME